jgi:two-component system OmpR family sensor kinase
VLQRLSLRARLVLGVIVLATAGLIAADIATYTALKSFLFDRIDNTLNSVHPGVENALFPGRGPGPGPGGDGHIPDLFTSIPGDCIAVRRLNQSTISSGCIPPFGTSVSAPGPSYPATIDLPAKPNGANGDRIAFFTTKAVSGGGSYRVRASIEGSAPNRMLLIAAPLNDVTSTLNRLLLIEILVTAIVLAAMTALSLWIVRIGLRPLDEIEETAAAIAAGDLSQRVQRADNRTEVGRLGIALNRMLEKIEEGVTALEASEAKLRRFVADASHELRTPLAAVRAYAELYTRGAANRPDDLDRSMKGISRESERMSVLVDDLLLLAHLDEGRPLTLEPVALDEVVGEALETARTLEPDRPVRVELEPAVVAGDRDRLRQVVDNLLSNVRSHTPPGTAVTVGLARNNGTAVLTVADSGPGMGDEQLAHVFERFYRADPSRARASGGAGLGLAIVAAVVDAHGGEVDAESTPGEGTSFRVRLPLATS